MNEFLAAAMPGLLQALEAVIAIICGYVGIKLKQMYNQKINSQEKIDVVWHTVKYVEQIYKDLHGQEKLDKAVDTAGTILKSKGIPIGADEIRVLIESAVSSMNDGMTL